MSSQLLHVLLAGAEIGLLRHDRGRATLLYHDTWRQDPRALPLSLSLPLVTAEHASGPTEAYIWGLLPDNDRILEQWARRFHVSPRNPFSLIANVGEDCAGAVQFVRSDRLQANTQSQAIEAQWLEEDDIAQRLKNLRLDQAAWRAPSDLGQFSLAGAQPKIALLLLDGRWGVPSGRTPTTHILKPPIPEHDGHAENEHFCLLLAKALNLPTANSEVRYFAGEAAIVVERYDRAVTASLAAAAAAEAAMHAADAALTGADAAAATLAAAARAATFSELAKSQPILRLHQEDLCQALGLLPIFKYQSEGGPGIKDAVQLLRVHSSRPREDVATFLAAIQFNWLIAGPDAHAKNYSLLHGGGGRVRLAPLYDLASILPYGTHDPRKVKLAMKIGGRYELDMIGARQWEKLATEVGENPEVVLQRVTAMAEAAPGAIAQTLRDVRDQGLKHPMVDRIADRLTERARHCLKVLRL